MAAAEPRRWTVAASSVTGRVRPQNEDRCGTFENATGARLFAVADGMGGHRGGATASQLALDTLAEAFAKAPAVTAEWLAEAVQDANRQVFDRASHEPGLRGMGTTLVAVAVDPGGHAWVAHVGDSRAYRLRAAQLVPLTEDHSVVAEMLQRGLVTPEEARVHPRRNEILRSVGVAPSVEVDVRALGLSAGDRLLLCSDGLSGVVSDAELARLLADHAPAETVERAIESANDRGGPDNITAVVVEVPAPPAGSRVGWSVAALVCLLVLAGALLQFASVLIGS